MTQPRPSLEATLYGLIGSSKFVVPGIEGICVGNPKLTIVFNALTFGTELNGLATIQRVKDLAAANDLKNVRILLVAAHPAAALAGVDHFGDCLNRLPLSFNTGPDHKRAAELRDFFTQMRPDVVVDVQENSRAAVQGMVVDIAGEPALLNRLSDALPCTTRLRGITHVQQRVSNTKPLAAYYNAKAAVEVLLPASSSNTNGPAWAIADAILGVYGVLSLPRQAPKTVQTIYSVTGAYVGRPGAKYTVASHTYLNMYAPVERGDVLAVDEEGSQHIVAERDGQLIFGPREREFTAGPYEIWWQVGPPKVSDGD